VDIEIAKVTTTVGFSYSTTSTYSKTASSSKTWSDTYGPVVIPPCHGVNTECYILTAVYNPTFTAMYSVNGTAEDDCNQGYWGYRSLDEIAGKDMCIICGKNNQEVCASSPIVLDNTITATGTWTGTFGSEVVCSSTPYPVPANQCY